MKFSGLTIVAPAPPRRRATYAPAKPPPATSVPPRACLVSTPVDIAAIPTTVRGPASDGEGSELTSLMTFIRTPNLHQLGRQAFGGSANAPHHPLDRPARAHRRGR